MSLGDTWFPKRVDTKFVVKNITKGTRKEKTIKLFNFPIPPGKERDLLAINYVSEADIRHSLLKGELRVKGEVGEILVTESNIDLLQFEAEQKTFLQSIGITDGLEVTTSVSVLPFLFKQNIELIGTKNGTNRIFTTPDVFVNGTFGSNEFRILIRHNGKGLIQGVDFTISESGGSGSGYDTITFVSFIPISDSTLYADYVTPTP